MNTPFELYRCGWRALRNEAFDTIRHPPVPGILNYWFTGFNDTHDSYVGIVAVPPGIDPMVIVRQEFFGVEDHGITKPYVYGEGVSDRFPESAMDWNTQRQAYFAATGKIYTRPIVGHYQILPDNTWWCTTQIELFDL